MSAIKKLHYTEEEYLRIERAADTRSEYYRGEMFAMAGASRFHSAVKDNLITRLNLQMNSSGCRTYSSDMKVWSPFTGLYSYPDIVIVCGQAEMKDKKNADVLMNPKIIVEVLSQSTEGYDRGFKFKSYKRIESCQEYVLVSQNEPCIETFTRQPNNLWLHKIFEGIDSDLVLTSIPVRIPLREVYQDVDFDEVNEFGP